MFGAYGFVGAGAGTGAGAGAGALGPAIMKGKVIAGKSTVKGTSPEMPVASQRDMGIVAIRSFAAPQSPGHRSTVSFTV